jgi:chromosome segregation ATPase
MEHSQLSQMVSWLDEAHQQDRAELGQLRQHVEMLLEQRDEYEKRIEKLESLLAGLQGQQDRLTKFEEQFGRFSDQVNQLLDKSEARRQQALRDSDRIRQAEIENVTKTIADFRKEIERVKRMDETLAAQRADWQRITREVTQLTQQFSELGRERDEWKRSVAFLEDQRRQDARRVGDVQTQITDTLKRIESLVPRIQHIEQLSPRLTEIKTSVEEIRQAQGKDQERMQFQDMQRERQMATWSQDVETYRQRMAEFETRMERYAQDHHLIKRATEQLEAFQEGIQRQVHEMTELQRLAQERQQTHFNEWQDQDEQRWQKHVLEWERHWGDYDKALTEIVGRLDDLEKRTGTNDRLIQMMLRLMEDQAEMNAMAVREWQARFEQAMDEE